MHIHITAVFVLILALYHCHVQSALSKELSQLAKARSTALTRRAQLELDVKEARAAQDSGENGVLLLPDAAS